MSLETHRVQVEQAVKNYMTANYPAVPVKYENVPFNQPDGPFVAVYVMSGDSFRANLGGNYRVRHACLIQIDVLVPVDKGTKDANNMAEGLGLLFQEQDVLLSDGARVIYRTPTYETMSNQGGFYRKMVRIGATRDENY